MLPSSPYTMLKLSKTTSPNILLHNDCVTLYNHGFTAVSQQKRSWYLFRVHKECPKLYYLNNSCFYERQSYSVEFHTDTILAPIKDTIERPFEFIVKFLKV